MIVTAIRSPRMPFREDATSLGRAGLLALLWLFVGSSLFGGDRFPSPPGDLDSSSRVLFYLHGAIVEGRGSGVQHPRFGAYEYDEVAKSFAAAGWIVISEVRPSSTRVEEYAAKVAREIKDLLAVGFPPANIAVMGHSKGGGIALKVAALMNMDDLRFVILAGCFPGTSWKALEPKGSFLSIYDERDEIAVSCNAIGAPDRQVQEIRLREGTGHGLFFRARASWVDLVLDWLE